MKAALLYALLLLAPLPAHAQLVGVLRPLEIVEGTSAQIKPCPGDPWPCEPPLVLYDSLNIVFPLGGTKSWMAKEASADFGDSTVCVSWADSGTNGERGGGVFSRMVQTGNTVKAVTFRATDARNTDFARLGVITGNTATGASSSVSLVSTNLNGGLLVYAGSDDAADCECRADGACHCYCAQFRVCLTTETLQNGNTRFTGTITALGEGAPGGGRHYDPFDATGTVVVTVVYEGALPAGIPASGSVGIVASTVQAVPHSAFANFTVTP